jgi:hypothetical protein
METAMKKLFGLLASIFVFVPAFALAQSTVYLGFQTGTLNPTREGDNSDTGFAFGASATAVTNSWFGFGASYLGSVNGETAFGSNTTFQSGAIDFKFMANAPGRNETGFTPYMRGGIGLYQIKADVPPFGVTEQTGINAQIPVGAGFLLDLNSQIALGGDVAYHILFDANFTDEPDRSNIDVWDATANLVFKL